MPKYIEREATVKLLRSIGSRDYRREEGTLADAIKMVMHSEYTPTADVAPVRHGRWMPESCDWVCSECGEDALNSPYSGLQVTSSYCPHCGAKMDKEDKPDEKD